MCIYYGDSISHHFKSAVHRFILSIITPSSVRKSFHSFTNLPVKTLNCRSFFFAQNENLSVITPIALSPFFFLFLERWDYSIIVGITEFRVSGILSYHPSQTFSLSLILSGMIEFVTEIMAMTIVFTKIGYLICKCIITFLIYLICRHD